MGTVLGGDPQRDRVRTSLARFVGIGYLIYAVIALPQMASEADGRLPQWYPVAAALLAFGPGFALLAASLVRAWHRGIAALALSCAIGLFAAAVLWLALCRAETQSPAFWILDFAGLVGMAAVLVRPVREAIALLAVAKLLGAMVAVWYVTGADVWSAVEEALFGIVFTSVCVLLAHRVLRLGAELDESRSKAESAVAQGVAEVEAARVDALIHDYVLSTFVAVAADRDDPRVADQAAGALEALDRLADEAGTPDDVGAREAVARLRAVIARIDGDLPVTVEIDDHAIACPDTVISALAEAAAEAVRNSVVHAGAAAATAVFIGIGPDLIQIVVTDDGVGFDPESVSADRLGLALSIRHRVGVLRGGEAVVVSRPGQGCTVRLRWSPAAVSVG
ncbi:ATP-binding protein [Gordonia sp. LUNF6]|uniref:sensor histidine kinase n=1 Tax=Gordonia TaxID=2053 RepID=UPI00241611AF|nr:ATP-binding protein [Gordonia sihwensis]WFN92085.1 histidine kinase [Gordonia sihwensis]